MSKKVPRILITNDDGIGVRALEIIERAVASLGEVFVVAPQENQSAASHSFTLRKPIKICEVKTNWYAVDGTPTDCVLIAYHALLNKNIDLVLSGINNSPNMGDDVLYSGTVAAAIEGTILGIPSIAFSYLKDGKNVKIAQKLVYYLTENILHYGLPPKTLLNVNIPAQKIRGIKITKMGKRIYQDMAIRNDNPQGEISYIIDGKLSYKPESGTDFEAVANGYISITPLHLDMTNYQEISRFQKRFSSLEKLLLE
ncbi:MAG: 5'/3'-nucleotidase SurE [candidate division WOR-3 bacterium]|nr:5'/3'-nucleotidase SurE [candidate division WOR-3 bacterium]MCX7756726.1 5'/3'-nucleotidase SurE [candidate division WOR-3 bacterium]MDW7987410.1 5'/3'-nucleotidase SurE [candidate division WOR-3 bacterium]